MDRDYTLEEVREICQFCNWCSCIIESNNLLFKFFWVSFAISVGHANTSFLLNKILLCRTFGVH